MMLQPCHSTTCRPPLAPRACVVPRCAARRPRVAARAALDASVPEAASGCPFLAAAASPVRVAPVGELASLGGPGWRVLPAGNLGGLPQPAGRWYWNPLLGEFRELERDGAGAFLLQRYRQFGPVFSWVLGQQKLVAVLDAATIRSLLKAGDSRVMVGWNPPSVYAMLGENTRRNLETPAVRINTRRLLAPGFSREALRRYMPKLVSIVSSQLDDWSDAAGAVDLTQEGKHLSFEFSTQLLVDFDIPPSAKAALKARFDRLFRGMFAPPLRLPGSAFADGLAAKAELLRDIAALVARRGAAPGGASGRRSVFDFNIEARRQATGREPNEFELAESGIGLIIAGNDTSGLGVTALLAVLPQFPAVMDALREEQQQVIARFGPALSVSALDHMPYAAAVVAEVLRVAPPSAQVMRRTLVDLEVGGKFVPAGSVLYLSSFLGQVLSDPALAQQQQQQQPGAGAGTDAAHPWAVPQHSWAHVDAASLEDDFKPERWLVPAAAEGTAEGEGEGQDAAAPGARPRLLTFSAGPHACLGLSLFYAEAKVLLAVLARGYTAEPEQREALRFDVSFVTQLKEGRVRFGRHPQPLPFSAAPHPAEAQAPAGAEAPARR